MDKQPPPVEKSASGGSESFERGSPRERGSPSSAAIDATPLLNVPGMHASVVAVALASAYLRKHASFWTFGASSLKGEKRRSQRRIDDSTLHRLRGRHWRRPLRRIPRRHPLQHRAANLRPDPQRHQRHVPHPPQNLPLLQRNRTRNPPRPPFGRRGFGIVGAAKLGPHLRRQVEVRQVHAREDAFKDNLGRSI